MPREFPITVRSSAGETSRFRSEIFAGTLIRQGMPAETALETARELHAAVQRARLDELLTSDLRHVAEELITDGTTRLAVDLALERVVGGGEREARGETAEPNGRETSFPSRSGPFGGTRLVLDQMDSVIAERAPELARFSSLTASIAESLAARAARDEMPKLIEALRGSKVAHGAALDHVVEAIDGGVIYVPPSPRLVTKWHRSLTRLIETETLDPNGDAAHYTRALGAAFVAGLAQLGPLEDQPPGDDPRDTPPPQIFGEEIDGGGVYVKVGSLERRAISVNWPLYCYERQEWRDELDAVDATYIGSSKEALKTIDDAIGADGVQVAGGWKADLFSDLPDGYFYEVPPAMDIGRYTWTLVENDSADGFFGVVQQFVNDSLKDNADKISQGASDGAAALLGGAAGLPQIGGAILKALVGEIVKGFVSWVVELIVEFTDDVDPFPSVTVNHLTIWHQGVPVSIVGLSKVAGGGSRESMIPLGRKTRTAANREVYADDIYRRKIDRWARTWQGESAAPGPMPYSFMRKVHQHGLGALVWRQARQGFGAVVRQVNIDDEDGKYSVAVRADVRLVDPSVLPDGV